MKYLNYLIKPASSLCNLRCRYCFYCDIAENRSVANLGLMQPDTVQALLQETFSQLNSGGGVHFAFQGGEPTLAGLDFFRDFVIKGKEYNVKNVSVTYSLQTNGTLLDENWAVFLKEHDFLVGLSLDGTKDLHDLYRVDVRQEGTWSRVSSSYRLLEKHRVRTNILCVVTAQCAKHPEKVYNQLKNLGARYFQFIPCLDPLDHAEKRPGYSLSAEAYGKFLCRMFDLWYRDWTRQDYCSIRLFEDYVNILLGQPQGTTCSTCGQCGGYLVVEGDGSVYPCDFFALDKWKLGNIRENAIPELVSNPHFREFMELGQNRPAECTDCPWVPLCRGGCKNDWVGAEPHNRYCPALKAFFTHAYQRLITVARAEQQARRRSR